MLFSQGIMKPRQRGLIPSLLTICPPMLNCLSLNASLINITETVKNLHNTVTPMAYSQRSKNVSKFEIWGKTLHGLNFFPSDLGKIAYLLVAITKLLNLVHRTHQERKQLSLSRRLLIRVSEKHRYSRHHLLDTELVVASKSLIRSRILYQKTKSIVKSGYPGQ